MLATMITVAILVTMAAHIDGHGRLINPPGRSTMWRYGFDTPRNSDDHQLSCGGFGVQFYRNGGRCGICGDRFDGPRDNEAGGRYATGTIADTYNQGKIISAQVEVTVNHGGWFEFRLCPNNNPKKAATQQCLDKYLLKSPNGVNRFNVPEGLGVMTFQLQLPKDLTCTQCVLQWRWNTASNVRCSGGQCCRGCGAQEQFYGCSDIAVTASHSGSVHVPGVQPTKKPIVHVNIPPAQNIGFFLNQNPHNNNNNNNVGPGPASFIPVPTAGQSNHNNQNTGNTLPSGVIQIPVDNKDTLCQATKEFKWQNPLANTWCMINCASGYCPVEKCNFPCARLLTSGLDKNADCKATTFWRKIHATADEWCREKCNAGFCPKDYCDDTCRNN